MTMRMTMTVSAMLAVALAVLAAASADGTPQANALWIAALVMGTVALLAVYGVAIDWARRRKRLWG